MATVIGLGMLIFFIWIAIARGSKAAGQVQTFGQLARGWLPARGLVLASTNLSTGATIKGRRFEQRQMTLEVEVYGRPPYVIQGTFMVPRGLVEAIPGSSLELSVDASAGDKIAILGPGGFTGPWLNLGPPRPY